MSGEIYITVVSEGHSVAGYQAFMPVAYRTAPTRTRQKFATDNVMTVGNLIQRLNQFIPPSIHDNTPGAVMPGDFRLVLRTKLRQDDETITEHQVLNNNFLVNDIPAYIVENGLLVLLMQPPYYGINLRPRFMAGEATAQDMRLSAIASCRCNLQCSAVAIAENLAWQQHILDACMQNAEMPPGTKTSRDLNSLEHAWKEFHLVLLDMQKLNAAESSV